MEEYVIGGLFANKAELNDLLLGELLWPDMMI